METVGGRYALDGRLGEGGMGHVFRAKHLQLGKAFALKIISPAFAGDNAARARFNQEAKLASEISHPNIVSVVDYGEDEQFGAYMVMELVEGDSLVQSGTLPMSTKRALASTRRRSSRARSRTRTSCRSSISARTRSSAHTW